MAYLLSDDELRQNLEKFGEKVGPVTPTTRRVLQKRLDSLSKSRNLGLNTLSSDDSEVESQNSSDRSHSRKKRHNHRSSHIPPIAHQLTNLISNEKNEVFKKPLPATTRHSSRLSAEGLSAAKKASESKTSQHGRRSLSTRKSSSKYDIEISDSDMDTETVVSPMQTLKLRNKNSNHVSNKAGGDGYLNIFKRSEKSFLASTPNGDNYNTQASRSTDQTQKDWKVNVPRKSYRLSRSTDSKYSKACNANGYLTSDSANGPFSESKGTVKTSNNWIYVSWMLVAVIVAFFIFLGISYISAVQKTQHAATKNYLDSFICPNNVTSGCIPQEHFNSVVTLSRNLHDILSKVAGEYECQIGRKSRNLTYTVTKQKLEASYSNHEMHSSLPFDTLFEYVILLSLKNPSWGISMFLENGELVPSEYEAQFPLHRIRALESHHASKSLWCRMQLSVQFIISRILVIAIAVVVFCLSFLGLKYWKKRKDKEEKEFYELVENILDVLQTPDEMCSASSSTSLPCKAVAHLRDMILPLKERCSKQRRWDRAVAFIEENESRVQVDYEQIGGEDFKVWRWLPSPASDNEDGKKGKVWQGQAFGNLKGKNHIPYSPTPCLKIRNMFDTEVEYGEDWKTSIKDAILEKCEGNKGIVHIAVDTASKEGCVYMMCDCPQAAGQAYTALHGWWFDGKLVTVKYLRLERYLERFPDAEDCEEPLKPSNNKRLSLSTPFFSSALERS